MAGYFDKGNKAGTQSKWDIATLLRDLPQYSAVLGQGLTPAAQAELAANQAVAPGYAQLGLGLYDEYGRQYADIGREEAAKDALSNASIENQIINGVGADTAKQGLALQKLADPNYFRSADLVGQGIADWFAGQNPNGLSGSERAELEKTNARQVGYNPSAINTAANTMNTGSALEAKQSRFAGNLANISSALPTLKSGLDMTRTATSRSTAPNAGMQYFQGAPTQAGQWSIAPAGNYTSGVQQANREWNARQSSTADNAGKTVGTVASIAGAFCWVARAVYGPSDPRWLDFANWMFLEAPQWLYDFYMSAGERFAEFVKLHKSVRSVLKFVMNKVIGY